MENIIIDESFLQNFLGEIVCRLLLGETVIAMGIYKTMTTSTI